MSFVVPNVPIKPYAVYLGTHTDLTSPASYTFSSVTLGRASSDRVVVVIAANRDTGATGDTYTTVTIGGVSATQVVATTNGGNSFGLAIYAARVPTGETGNITLAVFDTVDHTYISVYALYGLRSPTAVDTDTRVEQVSPLSFTALAVPDDGIALALYSTVLTTGATFFTPTGLVSASNAVNVETMTYASAVGQNGATATSAATLGATIPTTSPVTAVAASWR